MKISSSIFFLLLFFSGASGQVHLKSLVSSQNADTILTYEQAFDRIYPAFLGAPYVEHTLDATDTEQLIIDSSGFDCVTLVENVLAVCSALHEGNKWDNFVQTLQKNRYYNAQTDGWESRIHYFSDWMRQATLRKEGSLICNEIGTPYNKTINFISSNPDKYPKMSNSGLIKKRESGLNQSNLHYLPKHKLDAYLKIAGHGDVLAFTTNISGLDVVHTGFAVKDGNSIKLLHASSKAGKVVLVPLKDYIFKYKYMTGLIIYRPELSL